MKPIHFGMAITAFVVVTASLGIGNPDIHSGLIAATCGAWVTYFIHHILD